MKKILFLSIAWLCITRSAMAISLPEYAYGKPIIFNTQNNSDRWETIVRNADISTYPKSANPWRVFITNEKAVAYESATSSQVINQDIHFMEDFFVADVQGKRLLLFYFEGGRKELMNNNLEIPYEIRNRSSKLYKRGRVDGYLGWVNIDDLLLWTQCPYTSDGIYTKVAIAKDLDYANSGTINMMPEMFLDKGCTVHASNPMYVSALEFYFVLKRDDSGNVLVYKNDRMEEKMHNQRIGWLQSGQFIDWNTRICWEPAYASYDNHPINDYAYTFQTDDAAANYNLKKKRSSTPLNDKRKSTQTVPRSPVLEYENSVALLSVLSNANGEDLGEDIEQMITNWDLLRKSMAQVNVVFVMDATASMKKCFPAMSKAVKNIANSDYFGGQQNIRFGVVAFRNYKDKNSSA